MDTVPFASLVAYLSHSGWMANVQFFMFVAIFGMLADRAWRSCGWFGQTLPENERIASRIIDQVTSACMSMGLLLTFSGLYQYLGVPAEQQSRWPLLLALGSSAIGYGAMMFFQLVGTLDEWRDAARKKQPRTSEERSDESQYDDDDGGRCRHLGGPVPGPAPAPGTSLGSIGDHAVEDSPHGGGGRRRTPGDLGHERGNGDLA